MGYQSFSVADAVMKISAAAEVIRLRGGVKPHESTRIEEAFTILVKPGTEPAKKKLVEYEQFLRNLYNAGGSPLVMVCIVGLGRTAMLNLKEMVKLRLPAEAAKSHIELNTAFFQSLAEQHWFRGHLIVVHHQNPRLTKTAQSRLQPNSDDELARIVEVAEVAMLEGILGGFILTGMRLGNTRRTEDLPPRFTRAMRLGLPYQGNEDVTLEVWLHPSFGECVRVAIGFFEELRGLLGDYLFSAMKASNRRKDEEAIGGAILTRAVEVSEDRNGDMRLKLMVDFDTGLAIWRVAFPSSSTS